MWASASHASTACGHATEIKTFSNDKHALASTEKQAAQQIPTLVKIYKQNPDWIFQGKTVAQLAVTTKTYLDECGLHAAARRLQHAISG
jgi:hypothetical protein